MAKKKNQIKTEYGNIDRDQLLKSTIMYGKSSINRFEKWLNRQNKKLGTNFTIDDFKNDTSP